MSLQQELDDLGVGETLELSPGAEFAGPLVLRKPAVVDGHGAVVWSLAGPVLTVASPGVVLKNLRIEVTGDNFTRIEDETALALVSNVNVTLENVDVRGSVLGGEECGVWRHPNALRLGVLKSSTPHHMKIKVWAGAACQIKSEVSGINVQPRLLRPGLNDVDIEVESLSNDTLLYGRFVLDTGFLRRWWLVSAHTSNSPDAQEPAANPPLLWEPDPATLADLAARQPVPVAPPITKSPPPPPPPPPIKTAPPVAKSPPPSAAPPPTPVAPPPVVSAPVVSPPPKAAVAPPEPAEPIYDPPAPVGPPPKPTSSVVAGPPLPTKPYSAPVPKSTPRMPAPSGPPVKAGSTPTVSGPPLPKSAVPGAASGPPLPKPPSSPVGPAAVPQAGPPPVAPQPVSPFGAELGGAFRTPSSLPVNSPPPTGSPSVTGPPPSTPLAPPTPPASGSVPVAAPASGPPVPAKPAVKFKAGGAFGASVPVAPSPPAAAPPVPAPVPAAPPTAVTPPAAPPAGPPPGKGTTGFKVKLPGGGSGSPALPPAPTPGNGPPTPPP